GGVRRWHRRGPRADHRGLPAVGVPGLLTRGRPPALRRLLPGPERRRGGGRGPRAHRRGHRGGDRGPVRRPRPRACGRRPDPAVVREPQLGPGQDRRRAGRYARPAPPRLTHEGLRHWARGRGPVGRRHGYTTEVSVDWSRAAGLFVAVMGRIRGEFPRAGDLTMLGAHSSHSYQTGTNLYFVYDYEIRCSPREEIEVYHKPLNAIIVEEALRARGSMVHHHGIGKY